MASSADASPMIWTLHRWQALSPDTLHAFLKLRSDIFVVEQRCIFPDMDGIDPLCDHLCGTDAQGRLLAYARLVPPGLKRPHSDSPAAEGPAIGRVVVHADARGRGLGRAVMIEALRLCTERWPGSPVFVSAQQHLQGFYGSLGFEALSVPYIEDGIPHVDLRRAAILAPP